MKVSGLSDSRVLSVPDGPTIEHAPTVTLKECAIIYGNAGVSNRVLLADDSYLPDDCYLVEGRFFYPAVLHTGTNVFTFRSVDVNGIISAVSSVSIERNIRPMVSFRTFTLTINGVDYTTYANAQPNVSGAGSAGAGTLTVSLHGVAQSDEGDFAIGNTVSVSMGDGVVDQTYSGKIDLIDMGIESTGKRSFELTAVTAGSKILEAKITRSILGKLNGQAVAEVCRAAGYTTVYAPAGNRYTGPRYFQEEDATKILGEIQLVESWARVELDANTIAFLPDYVASFISWTFQESRELMLVHRSIDGARLVNKARIKYVEPPETNITSAYLEANIPDKTGEGEGYAFYESDAMAAVVTSYSADSVVTFALWSNLLDWENVEQIYLTLKFKGSSAAGASSFTKYVPLETYPEKKIAVGNFDLRIYHLLNGTPLFWNYYATDAAGHVLGGENNFNLMRLSGTVGKFDSIITEYDVQMTEEKLLATVDKTWTVNGNDTLPTTAEDEVVFFRYDHTKTEHDEYWEYEIILSIPFIDAVMGSLLFDLDQVNRNTGVRLKNAEFETKGNSDINGSKWIFAVRPQQPNIPVRRINRAYMKLTGKVNIGDAIIIRFNIWGREFNGSSDFEDYTKIDEIQSDAASIARYGERFGGAIVSSYLATKVQAANRLRKLIATRKTPIEVDTLDVPGFTEIQANQLIRVTALDQAGIDKFYWILEADVNSERSSIEAVKIQDVELVDKEGVSFWRNVAPDVDLSLTAAIEESKKPRTDEILHGTVARNKYRDMFTVRLADGREIKYVHSRVDNVKADDQVLVAYTPEGSYIIVAVLRENMEFDKVDDLDEQDQEDLESEDPNVRDNVADADQGRDIPNYCSVKSITPSMLIDDIIPLNATFDIEMSHEFTATPAPGVRPDDGNISPFLVCYYLSGGTNVWLPITVQKVSAFVYRITPVPQVLPFDTDIIVGVQNITPLSAPHSWGREWDCTSISGAILAERVTETFRVEIQFTADMAQMTSANSGIVHFNQRLGFDEENVAAIRNTDNYEVDYQYI